jgi:hypothetical protein
VDESERRWRRKFCSITDAAQKTNETPSQKDNDNDEYSTKNHYDDPTMVGPYAP